MSAQVKPAQDIRQRAGEELQMRPLSFYNAITNSGWNLAVKATAHVLLLLPLFYTSTTSSLHPLVDRFLLILHDRCCTALPQLMDFLCLTSRKIV